MILKMYSVYDNKVGVWNRPFFSRSDQEAVRAFVFNGRQDRFMIDNASDYDLFFLGEFNDESGDFMIEDHRNLCNLSSFIKKEVDNA